jgi:hypothetical protein
MLRTFAQEQELDLEKWIGLSVRGPIKKAALVPLAIRIGKE